MSRPRARQRRQQVLMRKAWTVAGVAILGVLMLIAISPHPGQKTANTPQKTPGTIYVPPDYPRPYAGADGWLGDPNAPVLLEVYSTFT